MTGRRLTELDKRERRRAWLRALASVTIAWVALFGVYYLLPFERDTGLLAIIRLIAGIVIFVGVLTRETRRIVTADFPVLRTAEALGVVIPLFLVVFAITYLSLSKSSTPQFNVALDHTKSLYFTVTVFATVGFGDIVPVTDFARIIVSVQMLLDLVVLGILVRVLFEAATRGLDDSAGESSDTS